MDLFDDMHVQAELDRGTRVDKSVAIGETIYLGGHELKTGEMTLFASFVADFATTENVERYLYSTESANRFAFVKGDNAALNVLSIFVGNVALPTIPEATYSPYWVVGEESVFVISGKSANTSVWLYNKTNGLNKILDSAATVWSGKPSKYINVGGDHSGSLPWSGSVDGVTLFNQVLVEQEISDVINNRSLRYKSRQNGLVGSWQLRDKDVSGSQTLDISGNQYHATVNGATKNTGRRGYSFDGASDSIDTADINLIDSDFTLSIGVKLGRDSSQYIVSTPDKAGSIHTGFYNVGNTIVFYVTDGTAAKFSQLPGFNVNQKYFLGATYNKISKQICLYQNGKLIDVDVFTGVDPVNITSLAFGYRVDTGGLYMLGEIDNVCLFNKELTPLQMADMYNSDLLAIVDN